jgi:hypothetical protein
LETAKYFWLFFAKKMFFVEIGDFFGKKYQQLKKSLYICGRNVLKTCSKGYGKVQHYRKERKRGPLQDSC